MRPSNRFLTWIFAISAVCASTPARTYTTDETSAGDSDVTSVANTTHLTQTTTVGPMHVKEPDQEEARRADFEPNLLEFPSVAKCATEYSCIRYSPYYQPSCLGKQCVYFAAYRPLNTETVKLVFHLSAAKADYVAIGFTDDIDTRNTDFIACVRNGKDVVAKSYYWPGPSSKEPDEITLNSDEMRLIDGNASGPGIWCTVERKLLAYDHRLKNLREQYRQVYLWGHNRDDDSPAFVDETTSVNSWEMSTSSLSLSEQTTLSKIVQSDILPPKIDCASKALSCVRYEIAKSPTGHCDYKTCSYHLAFMMNIKESQNWPVFLSASNAEYVGLGRTQDLSQWASTDVIGCKRLKNNTVVPFHYWVSNPKQNYVPQNVPNGLKMIQGEVMGSGLWCSLSTHISSADTKYSNLTNPAYMLYVWGKVDKDDNPKQWADGAVKISTHPVNLTADSHINDYDESTNSATTQRIASGVVSFLLLTSYIKVTTFY